MRFGDWLRPRRSRLHDVRARQGRVRADASLPFDAGRFFRHDGPVVLAQVYRGLTGRGV